MMKPIETSPTSVLVRMWNLPSRNFLDYLLSVSVPQVADDYDRKVLEVLRSASAVSASVRERLIDSFRRSGLRVPASGYPLSASTYNYMRPKSLASVFERLANEDQPWLLSQLEKLPLEGELAGRLLRSAVADQEESNRSVLAALKSLAGVAVAKVATAAAAPAAAGASAPAAPTGPAWHDEALSIDERMALVKGMGLFEQLFAAMAQTDCTACGYDCEGYARAIADGEDKDLTKCAPGELETQRMLEKIMGKK